MTTIEHRKCYCGKPGSPKHYNNFLGTKGKVAYVEYCSDAHKKMFKHYGDMVELFRSNSFMLKQNKPRIRGPTTAEPISSFW